MDENPPIPLPEALKSLENAGLNNEYLKIMLKDDIRVLCVNQRENKKRYVSFKALFGNNSRFWLLGGGWKYYFASEDFDKIVEKAEIRPGLWETGNFPQNYSDFHQANNYGPEYDTFAAMSKADRISRLNLNKQRLDGLIAGGRKDADIITDALVDTTRDAVQINRSTLLEAMNFSHDEAKKYTQELVDSTCNMIKSSVQLISEDIMNHELMNALVEKSNGTTIQHMTKVYLSGAAFLSYYNKLVSQTSAIGKFRISFALRYRNFYRSLLPSIDLEDLNLERVFRKGMRAVPPELFCKWAVGFLIHDIGKAATVDYHEGETAYNRDIVIDHVRLGYNSVIDKTNFPKEASLIVGSHHEYYGDPDGYGYSRAFLEHFKKMGPDAKHNYCIAYELESMMDCETIAYFPAKVLEIIDVYDSLTDSNRKYRSPMNPDEAFAMIYEEFIKKRRKIDMILFDVFIDFMKKNERRENGNQGTGRITRS